MGLLSAPRAHRWNAGLPAIDNNFAIVLNGQALPDRGILAYDCDEGWVERCLFNATGRKYLDESGEIATELLRGTVTTERRRAA